MGDRRNLRKATEEITEWDWQIFEKLTSVELGEREIDLVARPERVFEQAIRFWPFTGIRKRCLSHWQRNGSTPSTRMPERR
jgi:hypothetical protein